MQQSRVKLLIAILFVLCCNYSFARGGKLVGQILEDSTKKAIPFAKIMVCKNNSVIQESVSDSLGRYKMENIKPDTVDILCEAKFYLKAVKKGVLIRDRRILFLDFSLKSIKD
jgi:hypothetical protein